MINNKSLHMISMIVALVAALFRQTSFKKLEQSQNHISGIILYFLHKQLFCAPQAVSSNLRNNAVESSLNNVILTLDKTRGFLPAQELWGRWQERL